MHEIRFYYEEEIYGWFSNFYRAPFYLGGKRWETVEHYYQAQKVAGTDHEERIRCAQTPQEAKRLGNVPSLPLRSDWEEAKVAVMKLALHAKYTQNHSLKKKLIDTKDVILIENSRKDSFWGAGADGGGNNMLGILLMELRDRFNED